VHVFPCLAANQPRYVERGGYWRGSVWPPINYALIKGLQRYGLHALAFRAADNHITNISQVYKETRSHWENYMPDSIEPGSIAQPDCVAWAGLASVALLIEVVMGVEVYAPDQSLFWHPQLREPHSLENLRCGAAVVNLAVTAPFVGATELPARLTTTAPIRLQANTTQGRQWIDVRDEWSGSLMVA
jgi:glycogen debranching enzyme